MFECLLSSYIKKSIQNTSFPQEQDYNLYNHLGQDEYHAGEENKV